MYVCRVTGQTRLCSSVYVYACVPRVRIILALFVCTCGWMGVCLECARRFAFSIFSCVSFLTVPNGMGVEADDALLDVGPQSLPAMRL